MDSGLGYVELLRMIVALVFVLSLIFGILVVIKKYGKNWGWNFNNFTGSTRRLEIKESLPVGPKQRVLIIRRDDIEHVIAIDSDRISILERDIQHLSQQKNTSQRNTDLDSSSPTTVDKEEAH